ncbi:MAG: hypothetical protein EXS05_12810 [Planctomycetaceae bacterium]|nr:hypothetical protein [Planctomycetaceae bacterium]
MLTAQEAGRCRLADDSQNDPANLARYVTIVLHPAAVQAAAGAGRDELERVAAPVMRAWPT